jgi:ABC-type transport system involved in cytochrome bd biosynthesis fused ATPase/permease subunit
MRHPTTIELGLQDAADTVVGGMFRKASTIHFIIKAYIAFLTWLELKGISGGERRRLSIGCIVKDSPLYSE